MCHLLPVIPGHAEGVNPESRDAGTMLGPWISGPLASLASRNDATRLTMPELPEVETVRRGLAPAMEGARLARVEVRDRRLRWPIAKDFEKRVTGKTVARLGR